MKLFDEKEQELFTQEFLELFTTNTVLGSNVDNFELDIMFNKFDTRITVSTDSKDYDFIIRDNDVIFQTIDYKVYERAVKSTNYNTLDDVFKTEKIA